MEEDYRSSGDKKYTSEIAKERLDEAVDKAQEKLDIEAASSPELRFALDIVEQFLRNKKRVCYGGTAMNAQLPSDLKFYSDEKDLPDYDFFTPDIDKDVEELVNTFKRAGFKDVVHRVGMHEGTRKILVNFTAVADMSEMDRDIYDAIFDRSVILKGIHYTDPDVLRMMMYLELSRPKGEVSRWTKVYERLSLINGAFPMKKCIKEQRKPKKIPFPIRDMLHRFCIENQRILAGARLEKIYYKSLRSRKDQTWETREGGAVVMFSPDIQKDALTLRQKLGFRGVDIIYHKARGEIVPARLVLRFFKTPVALLIQETACHAYNTMKTGDGKTVYIASLDTLITLYLSLALFTHDEQDIFGFSLMCAVERFIDVNNQIQKAKKIHQFPPFPLECKGYQKGYPTLLREKVERIAQEKAAAKLRKLLSNTTRKVKNTKKNKTMRNKK